MKALRPIHLFMVTVAVAAMTLGVNASADGAFPLRSPQIPFCSGPLQAYFTGVGQNINVTTDQLDAQIWTSSLSGNSSFTFMLKQTPGEVFSIGVYNVDDPPNPPLFQVFPANAGPGWFAMASFTGGSLIVNLFNNLYQWQGQTTYPGVSATRFGFYLQGGAGTFYSQDVRNGGNAQVLAYGGTGRNWGDWWVCFEDRPYQNPDPGCMSDYDDAVLEVQSASPVPAHGQSWGRLKSLYR